MNDVLMKGPDLLQPQFGVLIRFRKRAVAVSADIEKMFNQVIVPKYDQSALRFIWRPSGNMDPLKTYEMQVQVFGCISSPTICNHELIRAAQDGANEFAGAADRNQTNFYLNSFDEETEAVKLAHEITTLLELPVDEVAGYVTETVGQHSVGLLGKTGHES